MGVAPAIARVVPEATVDGSTVPAARFVIVIAPVESATEIVGWLHAREWPVFLVMETLALLGAGIVFGARLFALRVIPGWPRARRNVQLVHYAASAAVGCVLGGALLGPLLRLPAHFADRDALFAPGFVMAWGALGGASLGAWLVARRHGAPPRRALDAVAPALGVLVAVGRVGCFLAGCCFGPPSSSAWAVAYPNGTPAHAEHVARGLVVPGSILSLPVRPVALEESVLGLVMVAVGFKLARRRAQGVAYLGVVAVYAVGRLILERSRDDLGRGAGLSVASLLSLVALAAVGWAALALIGKEGGR